MADAACCDRMWQSNAFKNILDVIFFKNDKKLVILLENGFTSCYLLHNASLPEQPYPPNVTKKCVRDGKQLVKTAGADVKSFKNISKKPKGVT